MAYTGIYNGNLVVATAWTPSPASAFDALMVGTGSKILWESGTPGTFDTNLYRSANNTLKTDDSFISGAAITLTTNLILPATTPDANTGNIMRGTDRLLHFYGTNNFFFGTVCGNYTTTGQQNTFFGASTAGSLTNGSYNTSLGYQSLQGVTSGSENTAMGRMTLYGCTTGSFNTGVGNTALNNTNHASGGYNVGIGKDAGRSNNSGQNNIFVGTYSGGSTGSELISYNTDYKVVIGNNEFATTGYTVRIGNHKTSTMRYALGYLNPHAVDNFDLSGNVRIIDRTTVGSEMLTNGAFTGGASSWTLGSGWAYNSNNIIKNADGTGTVTQVYTDMVGGTGTVAGKYYLVSFVMSSTTVNTTTSLTVSLGAATNTIYYTGNQTYYETFLALADNATLTFTPSNTSRFVLDTVSMKEITGGDLYINRNLFTNTHTGMKIGTGTAQKLGFWNATPVVQSTGWGATNVSSDKAFDANATNINELADVVGTLIDTLKTYGILGA